MKQVSRLTQGAHHPPVVNVNDPGHGLVAALVMDISQVADLGVDPVLLTLVTWVTKIPVSVSPTIYRL